MNLYNMLFGKNPLSDLLLAALDLTVEDVGRFRNAWVSEDGKEIAIYTRNGGGNRECWHRDDPKWGSQACKHHVIQEEADVYVFMPQSEWPNGKAPGNVFTSRNGVSGCEYRTGAKQMEDRYVCEEPNGAECACPGCVVEYRLPQHPLYLRDEDDEFDCTYATIYFRMPEKLAPLASAMAEKKDPNAEWLEMLRALEEGKKPEVVEKLKPLISVLEQALAS